MGLDPRYYPTNVTGPSAPVDWAPARAEAPYGERVPTAADVEAIAALIEADAKYAEVRVGGACFLLQERRNQIFAVLELYFKQFKGVT